MRYPRSLLTEKDLYGAPEKGAWRNLNLLLTVPATLRGRGVDGRLQLSYEEDGHNVYSPHPGLSLGMTRVHVCGKGSQEDDSSLAPGMGGGVIPHRTRYS